MAGDYDITFTLPDQTSGSGDLSDAQLVLSALRFTAQPDSAAVLELSETLRMADLADLLERAMVGPPEKLHEATLQAEPVIGRRDVTEWAVSARSVIHVGDLVRVRPTRKGGGDGYHGRVRRIVADTSTFTVELDVAGVDHKHARHNLRTVTLDQVECVRQPKGDARV